MCARRGNGRRRFEGRGGRPRQAMLAVLAAKSPARSGEVGQRVGALALLRQVEYTPSPCGPRPAPASALRAAPRPLAARIDPGQPRRALRSHGGEGLGHGGHSRAEQGTAGRGATAFPPAARPRVQGSIPGEAGSSSTEDIEQPRRGWTFTPFLPNPCSQQTLLMLRWYRKPSTTQQFQV